MVIPNYDQQKSYPNRKLRISRKQPLTVASKLCHFSASTLSYSYTQPHRNDGKKKYKALDSDSGE
uniref:Uncharacterized protein n=1 Tax=Solanum lycopersicum TaxID=4081 RepID=A0A3Q7FJJ4_SOLLC